jgi:hypothetical protein
LALLRGARILKSFCAQAELKDTNCIFVFKLRTHFGGGIYICAAGFSAAMPDLWSRSQGRAPILVVDIGHYKDAATVAFPELLLPV